MKTEVRTRIVMNIDGMAFGYWQEAAGEGEWIQPESTDEVAEAAKALDCSPDLIVALKMSIDGLTNAIDADLRDIWKRLDAIDALLDS